MRIASHKRIAGRSGNSFAACIEWISGIGCSRHFAWITDRNVWNRKRTSYVDDYGDPADAFDKEKQEALDAGMNFHMAKPIDPFALYEVLTEHRKCN